MRKLHIFLLLIAAFVDCAHASERLCGAARDLVVQALERVSASSQPAQVRDANDLLKRSGQMCASLGDARYYRSVLELKLGNAAASKFALSRAQLIGSDAMEQAINPFELATPPAETSTSPENKMPVGSRWALVIGVGTFRDTSIDKLRFAAEDARMFAKTLKEPAGGSIAPDHMQVLFDEQATTRNIKASLNWIARQAQSNDIVVIYVATHGSARDLDSAGGVNYLITSDTELGSEQDQDALFATALPMIDLVNTVATRIHALRTAIFIDTCYSGGAHGEGSATRTVDSQTLDHFRQGSGRIIMTASRDNQQSLESETLAHGYFTYYLVHALQSGQKRPLSLVFKNVHDSVMARVATDYKAYHFTQEPQFSSSSDDTDFALGTVGSAK